MSAEKNVAKAEQFKFQNVLAAAKADALIPVEEGFALTEENLITLDARIGALEATNTLNAASLKTANESLTAANVTIDAGVIKIAALEATVKEYAPKAAVIKDLQAGDDKHDAPAETKYETSVDREAAKMLAESQLS